MGLILVFEKKRKKKENTLSRLMKFLEQKDIKVLDIELRFSVHVINATQLTCQRLKSRETKKKY